MSNQSYLCLVLDAEDVDFYNIVVRARAGQSYLTGFTASGDPTWGHEGLAWSIPADKLDEVKERLRAATNADWVIQ